MIPITKAITQKQMSFRLQKSKWNVHERMAMAQAIENS